MGNDRYRAGALSAGALVLLGACTHHDAAPGTPAPTPAMAAMGGLPTTLAEWAHGAQLFTGLGTFHRAITTRSPEAQRFFDQGMSFLWAFNHDEATRSFARAAELDPACAMCLWGVALTVGPNYNLPFLAQERAVLAYQTVAQATTLAAHDATPVEAALIKALNARYPRAQALDPATAGPVLKAYALAMHAVARSAPDDDDVQVLYAESLMNTNAWKLWTLDGQPAPGTPEIVAVLAAILARNPQHPGANHYYVHALEASPHPEQALAAAERLHGMMPAAGHLEHMPAHILQRIGRYAGAADANRLGAAADRAYVARARPPDYYPLMYIAHNFQFLAFSTAMQGRRAETLAAVAAARAVTPDNVLEAMPGADWYAAESYLARVRFGDWDALLAEPRPSPKLPSLTAGYLFATALALAERGRVPEAGLRLAELEQLRGALAPDTPAGLNNATDVIDVAILVAKARFVAARGDRAGAIARLTHAVELEDRLSYDEPADWFFPVRHLLGAALLEAGRAAEAEAVYRADLARNPGNGWALFGLAAALRAEHKEPEAKATEARFREAWKDADMNPTSSAL
jgi:tetratricopeptide (TPR) repeat protein